MQSIRTSGTTTAFTGGESLRPRAGRLALLCFGALIVVSAAGGAENAPASDASNLELQRQIVDALAAGRDATALLQRARSEAPRAKSAPLPRNDEAAQLEVRLNEFEKALKSAPRGGKPEGFASLLAQYESLRAAHLLFQDRFETVGERIAAEKLPGEIESRRQGAKSGYEKTMASLTALLDPTLGALLESQDRARLTGDPTFAARLTESIAKAREILAAHASRLAAPILRASTLPFRPAKLAQRAPKLTPTIQPSYLNPLDAGVAAAPADTATTDDAALNQEILAKAKSLDYDYIRIYEFVRNEIRTEWYAGGMKGAVGTLRQKRGNDVDQASLLIALFRASGLASRYVHGVVELPADDVANTLALPDTSQVSNALTRAGVAFTPVVRGGRVAAVNVEHTWVTAQVPYTNYRGAVVDASGKTWIPLAPAIKQLTVTPSTRAFAGAGLTASQSIADYLAEVQAQDPLALIRKKVTDTLQGNPPPAYEQQLGSSLITTKQIGLLPNTLPVKTIAVTEESATLSNAHRQRVRFVVRQGTRDTDPIVLDSTSTLAKLASERVTLSYIPATVADQSTVDLFGGLDNVPAYLVKLRPQVKLNGRSLAVATDSVATGSLNRLEIRLLSPAGEERIDQVVTAGGYEAIGLYAQNVARNVIADDPADTEFLAARLLDNVAATYSDQWNKSEAELGGLLDVAAVHPWPSVTVAASAFKVDTVLGRSMQLDWQGVTVDAALHVSEPIARDGAAATAKQWMQLSALQGSVLEHAIFQDQFLVDSISADKGLALAVSGGIPLVEINAANAATLLATLNHPAEVKADIDNWARLGFNITVPRDQTAYLDWIGSVWKVEDPATGAAGYFIAGGLAGGGTAVAPSGWLLQWLREAFARANTPEGNSDPLSGETITLISTVDSQQAPVGTVLPQKLAVLVRDSKGRPVIGAPVRFGVADGGGKLEGGAALFATITNSSGIAEAEFTLGQKTEAFPLFTYLNAGDQYATRIGVNLVDAAMSTHHGDVSVGRPFTAIGVPQAPTQLVRTNPSRGTAVPSSWSDSIIVAANDLYGNPVSNVDVTFSAQPFTSSCDPPPSGARNGVVFAGIAGFEGAAADSCPANPILGECGTPSMTKKTSYQGVWAGFIAGSAVGSTYRVAITSVAGSLTASYDTGTSCSVAPAVSYSSIGVINELGNNIQAAKPGEKSKVPAKISLFYSFPGIESSPKPVTSCDANGCTTTIVCDTKVLPDLTVRRTTGNVTFSVSNGGHAGGTSSEGQGTYFTDVTTGAAPGINQVSFSATNISRSAMTATPPACTPHEEAGSDASLNGRAFDVFGVLPTITELVSQGEDPTKIYLNENGQAALPADLKYTIQPGSYVSNSAKVEFFENGTLWDYIVGSSRQNLGIGHIPRGATFDVGKTYEAQVVLNGGDLELRSDKFRLAMNQKMFKDVTHDLQIKQDVDVLNQRTCTLADGFRFTLTQPGSVTLTFIDLDNPNAKKVLISDRHYDAGEQTVPIMPSDLSAGAYRFELKGVSDQDSHEELETGIAISQYTTRDSLAVGHVMVKGVDLKDGHMVLGGDDFKIAGRGPGLEFRRTYSSSAPYEPGPLGVRWSHNYESKIVITPCGEAIVIGGEGSGMRFVEDGNGGLKPLKGYHGSLIGNQEDHTFDFYGKDGTRYHYKLMGTRAQWDLDFIEDTNHNVTKLTYDDASPKIAKLMLVEDASKRQLKFTYEDHAFALHAETSPVIRKIEGPGGIQALFDYDDAGNLIQAAREDIRVEKYEYSPTTSTPVTSQVLTAYVNPNGARTTYRYNPGTVGVTPQGIPSFTMPNIRVVDITDGTNSVTQFQLDTATWMSATVIDPNGHSTSYTLNSYGSPLTVTDPAGTTTMTWSASDVTMTSKRDARGVVSTYEYDTDANVTKETVDGKSTSYTYQAFTLPPIKNRVKTRTDRNGGVTTYDYDAAGNMLSEKDPEGGLVSHSYAGNGDRILTQDPRANATRMEYDQYGNLFTTTDALGGTTRTVWSVRSVPVETTDALSRTTRMQRDALDRLTSKTDALGGVHTYTYDAVGNRLTETDEENRLTKWSYDNENRVKSQTNATNVTRNFDYDAAGNKTSETDWNGNTISYAYDPANRMTTRTEPLGRFTKFSYDPVGNVLSETDALNHTTSYEYDALNRRTKRTDAKSGITIYAYDAEGNKVSEQDALGHVTTFTYDKLNRLTQTDQPLARVTKLVYDPNGNKTQETDPNGGIRKFTYDALNRLVKQTDPRGFDTNVSYDAVGNVTTQINARLAAIKNTYDKLNRLETMTDASNAVTTYTYDKVGNRRTAKLPNNNVITNEFDALNRLVSSVDSVGPLGTFGYDANGNRTSETDPNGNATSRTFDALNRLTQEDRPEDRTVKYGYDTVGNKTSETDARNNVTTFHYDELNRLDRVTDALSHASTFTYDAIGNLKTEKDGRNNVTTYDYDDLNRLTKVTDALSRRVAYTYDKVGNRKTETDKRGTATQFTYDSRNQLVTIEKAGVTLQALQYDEVGNKKFDQDAVGNITTYIYDLRNLLLTESRSLAAISNYKYDSVGNRTELRDPENRTSKYTYDLRRRMLTETNAANETTTYTYDGNGNRLTVAKPKSTTSTLAYDGANRLKSITDPLSGTTRYTYDKNGNRLTQEDANHHATTYEYDELNRNTAQVQADSARAEFRYDENGNRIGLTDQSGKAFSYAFDAVNRETLRTYPAATPSTGDDIQNIVTDYDANNNVTKVTETYSGATGTRVTTKTYDVFDRLIDVTDAFGKKIGYQYDVNGNRTVLIDPDNKVTRYTFDALNRVSTVTNGGGVTTYEYDRSSLPTKTTYPNGTSAVTAYDPAMRVSTVSNKQGTSVVSSYQYTYDHNGNRLTQTEANGGVGQVTTYAYDDNDRLINVAYPDKTTAYTYDAAFNRLTEKTTINADSSVESNETLTYDARNQLKTIVDSVSPANSVTYDYDANGNQTIKTKNGVTTTFVYDVRDQLISVRENLTTLGLFRYDYSGLRISKDMGGQIVRYTYDDDSVLLETDNAGATIAKFDYGATRLLSMSHSTEGRQFYLFDALGSVSNLTTLSGTIQARYQYDAFGNFRAQAGASFNRFGFTGHEKDNETGLYYFQARYYDPDTGRFLSEDPYLGDIDTPPSLHRYLYAYANPTVYVDLDGYESLSTTLENAELNADSAWGAFGYRFLSNLYHVGTLGFASIHDPAKDAYDAGKISGKQYLAATTVAVAAPVIVIGTGGTAGGFVGAAATTAGRIGAGALVGAAYGGGLDALTQTTLIATDVQEKYNVKQTLTATAEGAVLGPLVAEAGIAGARAVEGATEGITTAIQRARSAMRGESRVVGEAEGGATAPTPSATVETQKPSSGVAEINHTPAEAQAPAAVQRIKAQFEEGSATVKSGYTGKRAENLVNRYNEAATTAEKISISEQLGETAGKMAIAKHLGVPSSEVQTAGGSKTFDGVIVNTPEGRVAIAEFKGNGSRLNYRQAQDANGTSMPDTYVQQGTRENIQGVINDMRLRDPQMARELQAALREGRLDFYEVRTRFQKQNGKVVDVNPSKIRKAKLRK